MKEPPEERFGSPKLRSEPSHSFVPKGEQQQSILKTTSGAKSSFRQVSPAAGHDGRQERGSPF